MMMQEHLALVRLPLCPGAAGVRAYPCDERPEANANAWRGSRNRYQGPRFLPDSSKSHETESN